MRIGINGFGRIGRSILRAFYEMGYKARGLEIVAINSRASIRQQAHLLKYDSVHGTFYKDVALSESAVTIDGDVIHVLNESDPAHLNWDVDVVFECSGWFNSKEGAGRHIADKVIVSAPVSDADQTIIYGVNHESMRKESKIISCGSCTTNCLAPVVDVMHKTIGVERGFMTTVHAYTNDQNVIDNTHKDMRRARACATSIIPTSTGAAKIIGEIIPSLRNKIDCAAVRVPIPNVSMIDFKFIAGVSATVDDVNQLMQSAVQSTLKGVVDVTCEPLVSIDFTHNPHSAIFDCMETKVVDGDFVRILAWYDNEWGFANRMLDLALVFNT